MSVSVGQQKPLWSMPKRWRTVAGNHVIHRPETKSIGYGFTRSANRLLSLAVYNPTNLMLKRPMRIASAARPSQPQVNINAIAILLVILFLRVLIELPCGDFRISHPFVSKASIYN